MPISIRPKSKWLDKRLLNGLYLTLCLHDGDVRDVAKHLNIDVDSILNNTAVATTYLYKSKLNGSLSNVVRFRCFKDATIAQVASTLAHEASHCYDNAMEYIGEKNPGGEIKAYGIQNIVHSLMTEFSRRVIFSKNKVVRYRNKQDMKYKMIGDDE